MFHTFLEKTSRGFYVFKSENNPIANDLDTIKSVLNLLNVLFSSFEYKESFQNKILQFIKNLSNINEENRIDYINNLTKILNKEISLKNINDFSLQQKLQPLFSNTNDSIEEEQDFFKRAFFLLNIPIEAYDIINLPDDVKETIELIGFRFCE